MISGLVGNILQTSELSKRKMIMVIQQVIWPAPVAARQERCRTRGCRVGRARKKNLQRLTYVKPLQPACHAAPAPLSSAFLSAARSFWWDDDAASNWGTSLADPCGSTTQRAVRLDDTMTTTPTLPSVGSSCSSTGKVSNTKKIQRLDICQAAPARLPRCTRPAVKRLLIRHLSLLMTWWCHIKFGDSIRRSVRLDNTEGRAARWHNDRHADAAECGFQLQLDRNGVERGGIVQDGHRKRRFRGLTYVKPLQPACHAVPFVSEATENLLTWFRIFISAVL